MLLRSRRLGSDRQLQQVTSSKPLARGATGSGVAQLQDLLADLGFGLSKSVSRDGADGVFGPETEAAVKDFQRRAGLKADGFAGPMTLGALDDLVLRNPALEVPSTAGEVAVRQFDAVAPLSQKRNAYL